MTKRHVYIGNHNVRMARLVRAFQDECDRTEAGVGSERRANAIRAAYRRLYDEIRDPRINR
jgi:hypothetical protein